MTQLQSLEVGRNSVVQATGLRDSSMLTQDENIIDIRFTVQYRLKDARAFLFENRDPEEAVTLAAESAVREIVGRTRIDAVLYEQRDAIAALAEPLDVFHDFFLDGKPFIGGEHPSIADIRLAATLEFLRAIDYDFPVWAEEYMAAMESALGDAYSEPAADVRGYIDYARSQT